MQLWVNLCPWEASPVVWGAQEGDFPGAQRKALQACAPPHLSVLLCASSPPGSVVSLRQLSWDFQVLLGKKRKKGMKFYQV